MPGFCVFVFWLDFIVELEVFFDPELMISMRFGSSEGATSLTVGGTGIITPAFLNEIKYHRPRPTSTTAKNIQRISIRTIFTLPFLF